MHVRAGAVVIAAGIGSGGCRTREGGEKGEEMAGECMAGALEGGLELVEVVTVTRAGGVERKNSKPLTSRKGWTEEEALSGETTGTGTGTGAVGDCSAKKK